jgi:uncharacterized peroxidase-related enzyme
MSRLPIPANIEAAPAASRPLLEAVKQQFGVVPNLFRLVSNSPPALEGYLALFGALGKGSLPVQTRQRIALTVAEANACGYCVAAHTYLGKNVAKLDDAEMIANRRGTSHDEKADAAVRFAAKVTRSRAEVSDADVQALKSAGYEDGQIVEIVLHIALNVWTNYLNKIVQTEIDFPAVPSLEGH